MVISFVEDYIGNYVNTCINQSENKHMKKIKKPPFKEADQSEKKFFFISQLEHNFLISTTSTGGKS
jgi:hypothetical protein